MVRTFCAGYFNEFCNGTIVETLKSPRTVRIAGYVSEENKGKVEEAIRIVNEILPEGHKIVPLTEFKERALFTRTGAMPKGEIHIGFDSDRYNADLRSQLGYTSYFYVPGGKEYLGSRIWIKTNHRISEKYILPVLVRELIRSLGLKGHVYDVPSIFNHLGDRIVGKKLTPLDKEALRTIHTHYSDEDNILTMGPWVSSGFDFTARLTSGCMGDCSDPGGYLEFGVYFGTPRVKGPAPSTDISRNPLLSGEVTWRGAMVGVDFGNRLVFGDTLFRLNLSNLEGVVLFHNLRARDIHNTNDFNIDRGKVWGEGYLGGYRVEVTGNSFTSVDDQGDTSAGVDGRFYGRSHEFVGGTLIQPGIIDAAFGAKR